MKSSRKAPLLRRFSAAGGLLLLVAGVVLLARGDVPAWLQNIQAETPLESALYRSMPMPGGSVMMQRPPAEALPLLDQLVAAKPSDAQLHSLRAMEEERQLDFGAAEKDWKYFADHATDRTAAQLALADFYARRLRPREEIRALYVVARAPAAPSEALVPPKQQHAWRAFERISRIIHAENLSPSFTDAEFRAWIARYPHQPSLYSSYFQFLLGRKEYAKADKLIGSYQRAFPKDALYPVKARALLEYTKGNVQQGLALYDRSFQPLWPRELIDGYFSLLRQSDNLRKFLDRSRAELAAHPEDLNAMARVFDYYQQENKPLAARQVVDEFRQHKESAGTPWTGEELYTLARLLERIDQYSGAARYDFALYNAHGKPENRQRALTGLIRILLVAPQQSIPLGAGDLSLYKDIGTMDPGPGFLNGILSLLFNSAQPAREFSREEQRAVPYFHYAEAAKLLALLDREFPKAPERAALHVRLLRIYVQYGESAAVLRFGRQFLNDFSAAPQRTQVALLMADADARLGNTNAEFAIYDEALRELAKQAHGMPLALGRGATAGRYNSVGAPYGNSPYRYAQGQQLPGQGSLGADFAATPPQNSSDAAAKASAEYSRVLERYLARLAALHRIPQALAVLRREVGRNPNDPALYERLAQFLQQNQLGAQEEEVYRRAIRQFRTRSWYERLARFYLRHKRDAALEQLTHQVAQIFAGSDLQAYFQNVVGAVGPQLYLRLNLYAHRRFPHNLVFVRNLLGAYRNRYTANPAAWQRLLSEHWFEDSSLRSEYFQYLAHTGRLDATLSALRAANPKIEAGDWKQAAKANPAAVDFYAEAQLWRSHFENGAPALGALAREYPADFALGRRASSLYRSLAYFHPSDTETAVGIEKNLYEADPGNADILARIGDIYGDRNLLAGAAPYWNRMADIHPGNSRSYVNAATVFWDYYEFHDALRLLDEGRRRLDDPSLFSYQEGAIYENQGEYARAIREYVKGALADGSDSNSYDRLMRLAARPKLASLVESETAQLAAGPNPPPAEIRLRLALLEAQGKSDQAGAFLLAVLGRTTSLSLAEQIESLARQNPLDAPLQQSLEKEASLTTDPVHQLEIRYQLVRFFEARKNYAGAQRNIEALYRENPKILGVVRATVDFYWRRNMRQQAIDVLLQAAKSSYPALRDKFDFEAARKATETDNYTLARQLLTALLRQKPYDGELLAAMADTYARAGDQAGLRDFYLAKIDAFRKEKNVPAGTISKLRRGLIPALTQLKEFSSAVDQYIELINRYPKDESLTDEAALYAAKAGLGSRLTDFYSKTVKRSPRDVRWSVVLARIETQLENYPAAVAAYTKAIAVRPDRQDLYISRGDLLQRLMRFDEAAADYTKLYTLSYHDPQWMRKVAEIRARQGKPAEAVAALKTAWIDGHSSDPENFFAVARSLASWGLLTQAAGFARQGVSAAGGDLLANPKHLAGAELYTRILTRLRLQQEAYARLQSALASATSTSLPFASTVKQVEKQGLAAVTASEWRQREHRIRSDAGRNGMRACLDEMGQTVKRYFTPEEKQAFARFFVEKSQGATADDIQQFFLPAAQAAVLPSLEVRWMHQILLANPRHYAGWMQQLVSLQSRRLQFKPLAAWLESYAPHVLYELRGGVLRQAATAYRDAGDQADELRVLEEMDRHGWLPFNDPRYFALLLSHNRQTLAGLADQGSDARRNAAAEFAVSSGDAALAYNAIRARGSGLPPVWTNAFTGLVGLYYTDASPAVRAAFRIILDEGTIGQRLGTKVDRQQQLAGKIWFYYGSRYGEYLGVTDQGNPSDYLPAILEESPGNPDAYLVVARYYADAGKLPRAIADFRHALALSPKRAGIRDRLAVLYWKSNRHRQAVAEWTRALGILAAAAKSNSEPQGFWTDFHSIVLHLRQRQLAAQLRPQMGSVLREYLRQYGTYRASSLLHSAYASFRSPAQATTWLLNLTSAASSPDRYLQLLVNAHWVPLRRREPIYQAILSRKETAVAQSQGMEKNSAQAALRQWQRRWLRFLIDTRQFPRARQTLDSVTQSLSGSVAADFEPIRLRLATVTGALDALFAQYRADPSTAPSFEILRQAASSLDRAGNKASARKILAFAYSREIESDNLTAANFLGLAEIRLEDGNTKAALDLLDRLTLVVGEPFANLDSAAALFEKTGDPIQAAIFLGRLVQATPWDSAARLRLARAQIAARRDVPQARKALVAIASGAAVPYKLRTQAARALTGHAGKANLGSTELNLLAGGRAISPAQANQPFFRAARIQAALGKLSGNAKMQLLRAALADSPGSRSARIQFFRLAVAEGNYRLALSDLSPLLGATGAYVPPPVSQQRPGFGTRFGGYGMNRFGEANPRSPFVGEPRPERLRLVTELATVMQHLGRLADAVGYLKTARPLETNPARLAAIGRRIARLQAEIDRAAANAHRRPHIHQQLDQDRVVRPRLAALASSPAAAKRSLP